MTPAGQALLARRQLMPADLMKMWRRSIVMGSAGSKFGHMVADAAPPVAAMAGALRAASKKATSLRERAGETPTRRKLLSAFMRASIAKFAP